MKRALGFAGRDKEPWIEGLRMLEKRLRETEGAANRIWEELKEVKQLQAQSGGDVKIQLQTLRQQISLVHWSVQIFRKEDSEKQEARLSALQSDLSLKVDHAEADYRFQAVAEESRTQSEQIQKLLASPSPLNSNEIEAIVQKAVSSFRGEVSRLTDSQVGKALMQESLNALREELLRLQDRRLQEVSDEARRLVTDVDQRAADRLQSLHALSQQLSELSLQVGRKTDNDELERRLLLVQSGLNKQMAGNSGPSEVADQLQEFLSEHVDCKASEKDLKELTQVVEEMQNDFRLQLGSPKLDRLNLEQNLKALQDDVFQELSRKADNDDVSRRLQALSSGLDVQASVGKDCQQLRDEFFAFQKALYELIEQKAGHGDVKDTLTILQCRHEDLESKLETASEAFDKRLENLQQHLEDRITLAIASKKPLETPKTPVIASLAPYFPPATPPSACRGVVQSSPRRRQRPP